MILGAEERTQVSGRLCSCIRGYWWGQCCFIACFESLHRSAGLNQTLNHGTGNAGLRAPIIARYRQEGTPDSPLSLIPTCLCLTASSSSIADIQEGPGKACPLCPLLLMLSRPQREDFGSCLIATSKATLLKLIDYPGIQCVGSATSWTS